VRHLLNLEVILGLLCVVALFLCTAGVEGCSIESKPSELDASKIHCWSIPPKYGGGTYCSDEEAGGNHGYVNPGSMEWEVE
jgi:hypothetical protein